MNSPFSQYNDFTIVSNDLTGRSGFTLTSIMRNEIFYLPAFLEHYRKLGVARFIILDDRSEDGSREYLAAQPDVMVLASHRRFADRVPPLPGYAGRLADDRANLVWRTLLAAAYTTGQWSIYADADEFIRLPEGMSVADLLPALDREGIGSVWGVMLDMYPRAIGDLRGAIHEKHLNPQAEWYFDGEPHLILRSGKPPRTVYPGSRARLAEQFHSIPSENWFTTLKRRRFGLRTPKLNVIRKPTLIKWQYDAFFQSPHDVSLTASMKFLLPIEHYKFTGALYARTQAALKDGSHFAGSRDYIVIAALLDKMSEANGAFLYARSALAKNYSEFERTGNAGCDSVLW